MSPSLGGLGAVALKCPFAEENRLVLCRVCRVLSFSVFCSFQSHCNWQESCEPCGRSVHIPVPQLRLAVFAVSLFFFSLSSDYR